MFARVVTGEKQQQQKRAEESTTNKQRNKNPKLNRTSLKCILQQQQKRDWHQINTKTSTKLCLVLFETLLESIDSNTSITVHTIFGI